MLKKSGVFTLLFLIILNLFPLNAFANTSSFINEKGYYDFTGNIGKSEITLSFYYDGNTVKGTYIYDKYHKAIDLDGKIDGSKITLNQYDNKHNLSGTFQGVMKEDDTLSGVWKENENNTKYKFTLHLVDILPGTKYNQRYNIAGFDRDKDVTDFVEQVQKYLKSNDASHISTMISYPIKVTINNKSVVIKSKKQFIKNYNKIFNAKLKAALTKTYASCLFANWQGVMAGSDFYNVWINLVIEKGDSAVRITAINN